MLSKLFDEYSLNARVRPSLLALLPVIISVYVTFPQLYASASGLISLVVVCGFITALAHFSRYRGRVVEKNLFKAWGGKPTTSMLRHRDTTLDQVTKHRYHQFFLNNIDNWSLPTIENEIEEPDQAEKYYESAIKWLLENTRDTKRYNLLFKENISYGFRRNCYGIKRYGVILSILSIALVSWSISCFNKTITLTSTVFSFAAIAFSLILLVWWVFVVNQTWVKDSANSFSIRLLAACDLYNDT